jgi:hypothetical protein
MQRSLHGERHPDYATSLNQLALLLIMHGSPDEAEPLLHRALAIRKDTLGEDHPDYATCLSSLAGLLWARGDIVAAEPLLRQAHEIRCRVLGGDHPRSIASRSCLEQFLRMKAEQRAEVHEQPAAATPDLAPPETPAPTAPPSATATPAHGSAPGPDAATIPASKPDARDAPPVPETGVAWAAAALDPAPAETPSEADGELVAEPALEIAPPSGTEILAPPGPESEIRRYSQRLREDLRSLPMSMSSNDLAHELAVLSDVFSDLGTRLMEAARQFQGPGTPPSEALVEELTSCRHEFANVRDRTRALGQSLHVDCPPVEGLPGLENLKALLDQIAEAEIQQAKNEELRRRSLSVLGRVLALTHVSDSDFAALRGCKEQARALHHDISVSEWDTLPTEADPLAEGGHALAHLMTLIEDRDELSDDLWAELHESVGRAFGKSLATAAARAKLTLPLDEETVLAGSEQEQLA